MQKHIIMCTQRKAMGSSSSAILKYLLENYSCTQRYASDCFMVIGRAETMCKGAVFKGGSPNTHTQANSQHSEGSVKNAAFHPIRAGIQYEVATLLLKPCEDAGEFDWNCWSTRFCNHDLHVLKPYKINHRFIGVAAKNLDKLPLGI